MSHRVAVLAAIAVFSFTTLAHAADPAVKCQAGKFKESGKYASCRLKAESKALLKGIGPDFTKCDSTLLGKFTVLETKVPGACPSNGDGSIVQGQITSDSNDLVSSLAGAGPPFEGARLKCYAGKLKESGKYASCRLKAESKGLLKGLLPDFTKCDSTILAKFTGLETKAAGACPTNGDGSSVKDQITNNNAVLVPILEGGKLVGGSWWFLGAQGESCDNACASHGLTYDTATDTYAGTSGSLLQCRAVIEALPLPSPPNPCLTNYALPADNTTLSGVGPEGWGCSWTVWDDFCDGGANDYQATREIWNPTTSSAAISFVIRACACM